MDPYLGNLQAKRGRLKLEVEVRGNPDDISCPIINMQAIRDLISPSSLSYPRTTRMPAPADLLSFIDNNADAFIKRLADAVAIPS